MLLRCTRSANQMKIVTRHVWQDSKERIDTHRLTEQGRRLYSQRRQTIERSFADAKQLHGHRYARMRGLLRVQEQCLLAAACQNMKKMALVLSRNENGEKNLLRAIARTFRRVIAALFPPPIAVWT